jgi:probable selenium-dependent hydroxylase accessory protein YqeC
VGRPAGEKVSGPTAAEVDAWELPYLELLVVEADGSRGRPVKAHADYEPVLPTTTTLVVAVLGMQALGLPAGEAHRSEILCQQLGCDPELRLGESHLVMVLEGYLQRAPAPRQVIVLNQADDAHLRAAAQRIGRRLRVPFVVRGRP